MEHGPAEYLRLCVWGNKKKKHHLYLSRVQVQRLGAAVFGLVSMKLF